jgi:type IV secretion system protein VirD4
MGPIGGAPGRGGSPWGWLVRAVLALVPLALLYGAGRYLVEEAERRWPAQPGELTDLAVAGVVAVVLGLGLLSLIVFGHIEARPRPPGEAPRLGQTGGWVLARVLAIAVLLAFLFALLQDAGGNPFAIDSSSPLFALGVVAFFGAAALFLFGPAPVPAPTSHGSARWAGHRDLKRAGLLASTGEPPEPGALLLAPYSTREHIRLPPPGAQLHALIVGPSGSGKTRGFFMPNCAAARGSFVVTDPKGELWRETSGYHDRAWRYAPREPEASRGFNWIPLCRDPRLCRPLARAVLQLDADAHEEAFWKLADLRLCAALFAHAAHLRVPTPATAYTLLQQPPDALLAELAASPVDSVRAAAAQLAGLRDHVRAGIVLSVADKLAWLDDPAVLRFTSAEVIGPDFTQLQRRPSAVYWVLHEQDVALLQPLSALFFTLLIDQLCRSSGPVPVSLFFDEFANIGPVPDFPTTISVARGRGLSLVLGVQSLSQLDGIYGRHGLPADTCEEVSRALGEWTLEVEYAQRRPYGGGGWVPLPAEETSWSQHRMARRLLTADEVRRMQHDACVIVVANQRPIFARRWWWSHGAREAPAFSLGPAKAAALPPPAKPAPPSTTSPRPEGTGPATTPPKPTLRDLKTKLERLDAEDLEPEDLPDDFGHDRRR